MAKSASKPVEITAESLQLEVPTVGVVAGEFLPADGTEANLPVEPAQQTWVNRAKAARAAANAKPDEDAPEPEHADIGNWTATHWRGRPLWRHKRTGQTIFKRSEVWRLRNLK